MLLPGAGCRVLTPVPIGRRPLDLALRSGGAAVTLARQALGRSGEDRTARWYQSRGFTVLDRNWRCRDGELDLVVHRDGLVVFCEVKTRSSLDFGHPAEAVGWRKQQRVRRLAARWLAERRVGAGRIRFDVAAVLPDGVDVIEDAF